VGAGLATSTVSALGAAAILAGLLDAARAPRSAGVKDFSAGA
jgi:predicted cation transporter